VEEFMSDQRKVLEVLKFELSFLEQGGYGRSVRTPWKPTSTFQDSPACINFNRQDPPQECSECLLTHFVPAGAEGEEVPCHHIPLNSHGETVHSMERQRTQPEMEEALRDRLRATIARLEADKAAEAPAAVSVASGIKA
jgi:hypothetical protein